MNKTILYRLFGIGSVPKKLLPVLEQEGIIALDEGMPGWFLTKHVSAPGKSYRYRAEGFSGCLVVTRKRLLCYTYWKRQINIPAEDKNVSKLFFNASEDEILSLSFESSDFRDGWRGVVEYRFRTDQCIKFCDALKAMGVRHGRAE